MTEWRKIGEVEFGFGALHKFNLYLNEDNSRFLHGAGALRIPRNSRGYDLGELDECLSIGFYILVKPIVDEALRAARDPSVSPNAR